MLQIGFEHDFRWEPDLRVGGGGSAQWSHRPPMHPVALSLPRIHAHNAATFPVVRDSSCFDVLARYLYSLGCRDVPALIKY